MELARGRPKRRSVTQSTPPPGFRTFNEFVSPDEEQTLLAEIPPLEWESVEMMGGIARRRVVHFGLKYGYESWALEPTHPTPPWLQPLQARAAERLGVPPDAIAEVLVSHYPPQAGIGWHRDAPMFGDAVLGVSLGTPCVFKLRLETPDEIRTYSTVVQPRQAYLLSGAARWQWRHHIPPVRTTRYSITFRTLKEAGGPATKASLSR